MGIKWTDLIGKRLLLTDKYTQIARYEFVLLEVAPSGLCGKFQNNQVQGYPVFWDDLHFLHLLEVLGDAPTTATKGS